MWKATGGPQGIGASPTVLEDTGDSALYMYGTVMNSLVSIKTLGSLPS